MPDTRPRVCVVDDDPGIRESLLYLFEDAGFEVVEAGDGLTALAILRTDKRPFVVLLDRMLPRLDGVGTLRRLRDEPPELLRRIAVLFMTARNDPLDRQIADFLRDATVATIAKPFDLDALVELVEKAWTRVADQDTATYHQE